MSSKICKYVAMSSDAWGYDGIPDCGIMYSPMNKPIAENQLSENPMCNKSDDDSPQ